MESVAGEAEDGGSRSGDEMGRGEWPGERSMASIGGEDEFED